MRSRRWLVGGVAAVALLLLVGRVLSGWYVDYRWFSSLGARRLWLSRAGDFLLLRLAAFAIAFLFAFANLIAVRHSVRSLRLPRRVGDLEFSEEVSARILNTSAALVSAVIGLLLALPHNDWMSVELMRHGLPFGETDPYFRFDLGTWLYDIPLEASAHLWAMIALVGVTLFVIFLYALTPSLRWESGRLYVSGYVRRHLFALAAVLLLLLGWSYRLDAFSLLHQGTGPMGALSAVDHRVGIPSNLVLAIIAVAAAMLVAWAGWIGQVRVAFVTITLMLLSALTVRQIVPAVAGRFVVAADPEAQEQSYRAVRNGYTRRAYGVDDIERVAPGEPGPSFGEAVRGASLWDGEALRRAAGSPRQGVRPNGAMAWEAQDGRLVAFVLEQPVGPESTDATPAWGISRVAADVTDDRGAPVPRDRTEQTEGQGIRGVFIHDSASSYFVVSDSGAHLAAAALGSFVDRLAWAWHLQNASLLRRRPGEPAVRVLLHRDVRDRVHRLYPFFAQGTRLTPIVWRDSVYWSLHLYSTSDWYPLSTPLRLGAAEVRYLHHAGVALVNAASGRTTVIASRHPGPMGQSWIDRFPELFVDPGAYDSELLSRIPPAMDGAFVVAQALAQAGLRGEFDARAHLPVQPMDSVFASLTTPPWLDRGTGTLSTIVPLLEPTDEVRGLLMLSGGAEPRMRWERLDPPGPKWSRIVADLQVAADSLRQAVRSTRPLTGAIRLLPTSSGPVAIQTHYAIRPDGAPQVLLVALRRGDTVVVGRSLMEAAGLPDPVIVESPLTPEDFRRRVSALYESMREAMRRGDWAGIGAAYEALGRLLRTPRQP